MARHRVLAQDSMAPAEMLPDHLPRQTPQRENCLCSREQNDVSQAQAHIEGWICTWVGSRPYDWRSMFCIFYVLEITFLPRCPILVSPLFVTQAPNDTSSGRSRIRAATDKPFRGLWCQHSIFVASFTEKFLGTLELRHRSS